MQTRKKNRGTSVPLSKQCGQEVKAPPCICVETAGSPNDGQTQTTRLWKAFRDKFGRIQKTIHSWCETGVAYPVQNWRLCEAHMQRAQPRGRPLGELGSRRSFECHRGDRRKDRDVESDTRILGQQKRRGNNGCGMVIEAVDRGNWIKIRKMSAPAQPWRQK